MISLTLKLHMLKFKEDLSYLYHIILYQDCEVSYKIFPFQIKINLNVVQPHIYNSGGGAFKQHNDVGTKCKISLYFSKLLKLPAHAYVKPFHVCGFHPKEGWSGSPIQVLSL